MKPSDFKNLPNIDFEALCAAHPELVPPELDLEQRNRWLKEHGYKDWEDYCNEQEALNCSEW